VPNITIGPLVVQALRKVTALPLETHLMIEEPDRFAKAFVEAGSTSLLVHVEGAVHLHRTVALIKSLGVGAGVVLNPATPASSIEEILPDVDQVLVMTVNPGFGGQKFIAGVLPKISRVRETIDRVHPDCELEVDGGIDATTAPRVVRSGARVLVAGSAIFNAPEGVAAAMDRIRQSALNVRSSV
jgi:ribulose-phosphate 3-epimerase